MYFLCIYYWGRAEQVVTARELDYHIEIELDSLKQCRLKKRYKNNEVGQDELQGLTPKSGGDYGCEYCGERFHAFATAAAHEANCPAVQGNETLDYQCDHCNKRFAAYDEAARHEAGCRRNPTNEVPKGMPLPPPKRERHHPDLSFQCDFCHSGFETFDEAVQHEAHECSSNPNTAPRPNRVLGVPSGGALENVDFDDTASEVSPSTDRPVMQIGSPKFKHLVVGGAHRRNPTALQFGPSEQVKRIAREARQEEIRLQREAPKDYTCEFCEAAFRNFDEALAHEEECRQNPALRHAKSKGRWAVEKNYVVDDAILERIQQRARKKVANAKHGISSGRSGPREGGGSEAHADQVKRGSRIKRNANGGVAALGVPQMHQLQEEPPSLDYTCDVCDKAYADFDSAAQCEAEHAAAGVPRV